MEAIKIDLNKYNLSKDLAQIDRNGYISIGKQWIYIYIYINIYRKTVDIYQFSFQHLGVQLQSGVSKGIRSVRASQHHGVHDQESLSTYLCLLPCVGIDSKAL